MALTQVSSEGIKDAQVKTADILDANITTAKVADNAITGAKVADNLDIPDNNKIRFGTGNDLELYHTGSHGYILNKTGNLVIRAKDGETGIEVIPDGAVELRHNNVKRLETTAGGIKVTGGTGQAALDVWATSGNDAYLKLVTDAGVNAPDYYQVLHQNSDNSLRIQNYGDGSYEDNIVAKHGGAVELYYDNAKKFETTSYGTRVYGNLENHDDYIKVHDAGKLVAGNSDDLQISHNGSNSVIQNTTGNLYLLPDSGGYGLALDANGASKLYYDGSKKFETTSDGGKITGDLQISNDVLISDHIKHHGDTNTALRFPAADTFTVETAGSERLRIDSSGRVFTGGVSTQPSGDNRTLNLCSTSTTEAGLSFSRSSSTMGSGNTSGQTIRLDTDGALTFNVHNVGEKLRIDSSGYVTKPSQPSFMVVINTNTDRDTTGSWLVTPWDTEIYDNGNNFNTTDKRFVAPVAGKYFFSFKVNRIGDIILKARKNGTDIVGGEFRANTDAAWEGAGLTFTANLAANDYIDTTQALYDTYSGTERNWNGGGTSSWGWDQFCGFLIH
jgi:hypothetical protein